MRRFLASLFLLIGCGLAAAADFSASFSKLPVDGPADPVVFDLDADGAYEVIVSGADGSMALYRAKGPSLTWHKRIADKALTPAVAGDFLGTGGVLIAVGSTNGSLYFLEPADGFLAATVSGTVPVSVAPTVVPGNGHPDRLAVVDDSGSVRVIGFRAGKPFEEMRAENTYDQVEQAQDGTTSRRRITLGRITRPLTAADVTGDGVPEIIAGTVNGAVQAIPLRDPSHRLLWFAAQGTNIATSIAVADFGRAGALKLVLGISPGALVVLEFDATMRSLREVRRDKLLGEPMGSLLVADLDGDGIPDVVGGSSDAIVGFEGAALLSRFEKPPYTATASPLSPLSLVSPAGASPLALCTDGKGTLLLVNPITGAEVHKLRHNDQLSHVAPAGDLVGAGKLEFVFLADRGTRLGLGRFDLASARDTAPVLAYGGNFSRDGVVTTVSALQIRGYRTRLEAAVTENLAAAEDALKAGKRAEAEELVDRAMALRPADPAARALLSRMNRTRNLVTGGVAVALIGAIGLLVGRLARRLHTRKGRMKAADQASASGDYASAIAGYRAVLEREPKNTQVLLALADTIVKSGTITPDVVSVLREARAAAPDNTEYTLALAQALAEAGDESPDALDVYLVAIGTLDYGRGKIAFHTGNILRARGEAEQALRYYKIAAKDGCPDPALFLALAELFQDAGQFSEKTLPAFEAVRELRWSDPRFMDGLCRCYDAARRHDEEACRAAERLLELDSGNAAGLRLLAKCLLQSGDSARAAEMAARAREALPDDPDATTLLAQALIASGQRDEASAAVYRAALAADPAQPGVLQALARSILAAGKPVDDADYALLRRASAANDHDIDLLTGVAKEALSRGENDVVIRALEHAHSLGHETPSLHCQLAEAYSATHSTAPAAEAIYREALKTDPDNPAFLHGICALLAAQNRTDADSTALLERAHRRDSADIVIGTQYTRALIANGRLDEAIRVVRYLLQHDKENGELQKLYAQASLGSNRIDEAIRQYEHLLREHPTDREATVNLAAALAQKQTIDDASAAIYERALALDPANATVRLMYARHHATGGRVARALEEFRKAVQSSPGAADLVAGEVRGLIAVAPERADLRWFLSHMLLDEGNMKDAMTQLDAIFENDPSQMAAVLQAYDTVLARDPNQPLACLRKGVLLKAQGKFEEARPLLQRAYQLGPSQPEAIRELAGLYEQILQETDDVEVRFMLGKLCYTQNDHDRAIGHFQRTVQDFRYENESIKMLGLCFVGKGMLEFALQEFKKLVIDDEMKEILYDLAQRYETKNDLVGAKQVYRLLFAADITYRNVKAKFEMLAGQTSDPLAIESTTMMTQLSERARRRYELQQEVGRGAMGIVYRAMDNELEETVALKILPENLSQNPEALARFRAEARSARRLAHPNIVRIHDIGEEMGRKYISMEFVEGHDLKRYFRMKGRLAAGELAAIMAPIARALDYAHGMGIVHRDIKPANIMLTRELTPKVSDFGIAKLLESTGETIAGSVIGTPLYMSPEQVLGEPIDGRADIYSLGVVMYEMLSGKPPFCEGDLAYQHVHNAPKPLEGIPVAMNDIVLKCLKKERNERWKNGTELAKALEESGLAED